MNRTGARSDMHACESQKEMKSKNPNDSRYKVEEIYENNII